MKIGIIAALPGELKPLVRGWHRMPTAAGSGIRMWERPALRGKNEVVAVCAGMGAAAARRAFSAAEFRGAMDLVLSIGWAGALTEGCHAGDVFEAAEVVDTQTGERFRAAAGKYRLVTTPQVAGFAEKNRLRQSYSADLVDMEAGTVARLAQMRGISIRCIKGISDAVDMKLPDLNPFLDIAGQLRLAAFLAHVSIRPSAWGALMKLGSWSGIAARRLAVSVEDVLRELED